jgi:signal transduction histidine kinase
LPERRFRRLSVRRPAILFALVLVCAVLLIVLWNVVLVHDYRQLKELVGGGIFHTTFIIVGSALLVAVIVFITMLAIQLFMSLRWSQRQANFIASVSHELNSPLTSIKLFGQTLRRNDLSSEDRARFVGKILMDTHRLSRLIANIVRAAEVDHRSDELPVAPGEVDLRAYLREYVKDAQTIQADQIELTLDGEEAWVEIDPIMFRQVLDNLIDNAVRYRGDQPARVALTIVPAGDWTELQVTDQGIGIPEDQLERVFERFYRLEEDQPQVGRRGVGIGLNVVRSIVKSHGGAVGARSPGNGQGTTIWIRLPAVAKAVEQT